MNSQSKHVHKKSTSHSAKQGKVNDQNHLNFSREEALLNAVRLKEDHLTKEEEDELLRNIIGPHFDIGF